MPQIDQPFQLEATVPTCELDPNQGRQRLMAARVHVAEDAESDEDEALAVAKSSQRGQVAMFTWPTPREYYSDYAERKKSKILIPSDMTRDGLLNRFRKVMQAAGHCPKVTNVLIALEPHQRFRPDGSGRELHYHIAFKLSRGLCAPSH